MATSTRRTTTTVRTASPSVVSKNDGQEDSLLTDLFTAYSDARTNKRNTHSQMRFERNLSENLIDLYEEIRSGRYSIGKSVCFVVCEKVKREIFAASFRDRIVHHILFNYLNPQLEPTFIDDSYSCRKGKGTLYAAKRMHRKMVEAVSESGSAYVLKMDIKSYFLSIDKEILFRMVKSRMDSSDSQYGLMISLLEKVIFNDPTRKCWIKGDKSDWDGLPEFKSLFHARPGCGLPIGNLTSQLFSNVYLSALDDYVTGTLGFRHYGRYVDDFYIIHPQKEVLLAAIPKIRSFLSDRLRLELHPRKVYLQDCRKGVTFVGYYVNPTHFVMDRKTVRHQRAHLLSALCDEEDPYYLRSIVSSITAFSLLDTFLEDKGIVIDSVSFGCRGRS